MKSVCRPFYYIFVKCFAITGIVNIEILNSISTVGVEKEELNAFISSTYDLMNREYKNLSSKTLKENSKKAVCERWLIQHFIFSLFRKAGIYFRSITNLIYKY